MVVSGKNIIKRIKSGNLKIDPFFFEDSKDTAKGMGIAVE